MTFSPELFKELIATFQSELEEGTNVLVNGLVSLETTTDTEKRSNDIETVFRTAHNLKGASRGLGIMSVGEITHAIESIFAAIQKSQANINKETIDVCLEAVDKLPVALQAFIDKKPLTFDLEALKKRLNDTLLQQSPDEAKQMAANDEAAAKQSAARKYVVDSIRIPLKIVDKLSELSEEVQASKIELDDHSHHTKQIAMMVQHLKESWKDVTELIQFSQLDDSGRLQKSLTRANDELMLLMSSVHHVANDIKSQSNEYSRLAQALHEEVVQLRLIPAYNLLGLMPRYARELANDLGKKVEVEVKGGEAYLDKYVLEGLKDPFNHLIRNAIDHGIESPEERLRKGKSETGTIHIDVKDAGSRIYFTISDDGAGIDVNAIKSKIKNNTTINSDALALPEEELYQYIFQSGFSTKTQVTDISGRGVGMDVVKKNINNLKGSIKIDSTPGKGTTFTICVPLSLSSERGLIVKVDEWCYVIPSSAIDRVMSVSHQDVVAIEGGKAILVDEHPIVIKPLSNVLQLRELPVTPEVLTIVILKLGHLQVALAVDAILGEREIVIKPIQDPLTHIAVVSGATLLERNKIAIVLDPDEIMQLALQTSSQYVTPIENNTEIKKAATKVLVVDDSITTRTMEKHILESKNFHVTIATNGQEAWDILQKQAFALVITDVNMPFMDGFELTAKIKSSDKLSSVPVIIVTSLGSDAEKARGIEVGADAYIVKNEFESGVLLQTIDQLI